MANMVGTIEVDETSNSSTGLSIEEEEKMIMDTDETERADIVEGESNNKVQEVSTAIEGTDNIVPVPPPKKKKSKNGSYKKKRRAIKAAEALKVSEAVKDIPAALKPPEVRSANFPTPTSSSTSRIVTKVRRIDMAVITKEESTSEKLARAREKRERSTPVSERQPAKRRPTYREMAGLALTVAVKYKDGRQGGRLSSAHVDAIRAGLRLAIDKIDGPSCLKIASIKNIYGALVIECHDDMTKLWVESEVEKLHGGLFVVVAWAAPSLNKKVKVWIRDAVPPRAETFFSKLSQQNMGFDTSNWLLAHTIKSGAGFVLFLRMDESGLDGIKPPAKLYYYTDLLRFDFEEEKVEVVVSEK
jgi:hypothetical protein